MGRFDGKNILVTGGTSGIGGSIAELCAAEGATVAVTGRDQERGRIFVKETRNRINNDSVFYYPCDVGIKEDIMRLHNEIRTDMGEIDILVSNAGMLITAALEDITEDDWDKMYQTNVKATMLLCQEFVEELVSRKGVILVNASINGLHSFIKGTKSYMYATSKSALIQFTRYMAKNYAPNIRVNCLCPGITETNLFTNRDFTRFKDSNLLRRMARPEEIAKVAQFLISDDATFVTGSVIVADGGETIK